MAGAASIRVSVSGATEVAEAAAAFVLFEGGLLGAVGVFLLFPFGGKDSEGWSFS